MWTDKRWLVITIAHPESCTGELKTLKNLLLQDQENFEAESWHTASDTLGQPSLFK